MREHPDFADASPVPGELARASAVVGMAVLLALAAAHWLQLQDLSIVFITAVIVVAARSRVSVAVYTALLCFLAYNWFFIHPRHTLYVGNAQGATTLAGFLLAALVCGRLASHLRAQVVLLRAAQAQASALQRLGQRLTAAADEGEVLRAATDALREALDAEVLVLAMDEGSGQLQVGTPQFESSRHDPALQMAVARCLNRGPEVGSEADLLDLSWHCLPVRSRERLLALACLRFPSALPALPPAQADLIEAMLRELAQALARARLVRQLEQTRLQGEGERLRSALLSSVSHDLRSPLSTIIGSAESLSVYHQQLSSEDQLALAQDIHSEGRRLDHYIQNLLDMTRVGQGALSLHREWVALDEVCGALLARLRRSHPEARVLLQLPTPAPWLYAHPALIEQALYNVLDNAAKFSPRGQDIVLRVERREPWLQVDVIDRGPGISQSERERVFERFYTGDSDRQGAGTGLGLTICQGIVAAHAGQVEALPGDDGIGSILRLRLPLAPMPAGPARED